MSKDKKVRDGRITLILPRRIGEAFVMKDAPRDELRDFLTAAARKKPIPGHAASGVNWTA